MLLGENILPLFCIFGSIIEWRGFLWGEEHFVDVTFLIARSVGSCLFTTEDDTVRFELKPPIAQEDRKIVQYSLAGDLITSPEELLTPNVPNE
ncbi:hypothetical protein CDAR_237321 [Caerostris darwini]|uniref:Uncharacterized protein n=1 Tax=Caerostris darwini TaxID=1538125 RepID=A0AAV4QSG3_9ARAC|nr:hypothetical protein CDAR_237321 [Caerostris darwini]